MVSFSTAPGASRQLQTKAVCDATENVELSWNGVEKTAENTVQHRGVGGGLMVANHRGGSESSMVVTTLKKLSISMHIKFTLHTLYCVS